jgi:tetratricopeptide (TPR) repeat protein
LHELKLLALTVGVCLVTASVPGLALAAPAKAEAKPQIDTEQRAMKAYTDGKAAYDAGSYNEALQLFLDAQSLYPSPVFHYNVGLCQEALGNLEQAVISYEAYLRSYMSAFDEQPDDQVNTENKIQRVKDRMKLIELEQAKAAEQAKQDEQAKQAPVIIQAPPDQPEPDRKPGRGLIITGGVLTGLGVGVAAVGGTIFGLRASSISGQLDDVYTGGNPDRVTLGQATALDSDGRAAELNQVVTISIGGAVALTGVALLAVGLLKKNKAASAHAHATVVPSVGLGHAGLLIQGSF